MPMDPDELKKKMKQSIHNGFKAQFSSSAGMGNQYPPIADAQWLLMAEAVSEIAYDIVEHILKNAQVNPGIPTAGGPASQTTVAPGKIS